MYRYEINIVFLLKSKIVLKKLLTFEWLKNPLKKS
jgi:hypothetical protein